MKNRRKAVAATIASLVLLGAFVAIWSRRPPGDVAEAARRLWAQRGVGKPNLLLVTLDTTRADRLGAYGYAAARTPNLDALAARGVLFAEAVSVAPLTLPAHSSIMTGMYPAYHGVRINGNAALGRSQQTLAEVLAARGYATGGFVGAFVLDGRWGLNQGFARYDDRFDLEKHKHLDLGAVQRPGNVVVDAALGWLDDHKSEPFFAWVHLYDPHTPYEPPEPFLSEYRAQGLLGLYDGEIAFADQQVGRLLSWLKANGLEQKTAVVVVGDHGEGLGSHGEGTHGYFVYEYALHVPLIIATPFRELSGVRVGSPVSIVDIFPTVLALTGASEPAEVHGRSLLPRMFEPRTEVKTFAYGESMTPNLQYGWSPLHTLRSSRYKLIKAPRPELYDLATDPGETHDVIAKHPAEAEELRRALDRLMEETARGAPTPEAADLDKQTVASLAALGYVGAPVPARSGQGQASLADPKDRLAVFTSVQQAGELIMKDDYRGAAQALESALREEPRMPQALLMLGTAYSELGRKEEAKAQFDLVLKDDPQSIQALIGMANLLEQEGRTDDVIALGKRTLSLDDRNTQAYILLGEAYVGRGQAAEALPYFEKAVAIQPKLTQNRLNLAGCLIELKQFDRAEAALQEIIREYPRFPLAQFNLGLLHEERGRPAEARTAYAAEVAAYPGEFKARFNLGKVLFGLGDRAGAMEEMREVIRIAPERPEGHLFLARGLLPDPARIDEVEALAREGLRVARAPDVQALGWLLLADVFARRGEAAKVNEALRRAEVLAPRRSGSSNDEARHD